MLLPSIEIATATTAFASHSATALLAAAAGHDKTLLAQTSGGKRRQHLLHVAADPSDDSNPSTSQTHFERLRDGSANQRLDAKLREPLNSPVGRSFVERPLLSSNLPAVRKFDQQELPGHIEDRRYAALPNWKGEFHDRLESKPCAKTAI